MKRLLWAWMVLALGVPTTAAQSVEQQVEDAVASFGRAFIEADVEALSDLLADGYVHVNGGSGTVLGKADWLAWIVKRRQELLDGRLVVESYSIDDLQVQAFADMAIVTGIVRSRTVRAGEASESNLRFTNVWVRQQERWLRAAFHDSKVPAP